jgi:hypothetical protein
MNNKKETIIFTLAVLIVPMYLIFMAPISKKAIAVISSMIKTGAF